MDISLYTDCAVIIAALGSSYYCLTLRRELAALSGRRGLKEALSQLTEASRSAQAALEDIKTQVACEVVALDTKLAAVDGARQEVEDMLGAADGQVAYQLGRVSEAARLAEDVLTPMLQRAEEAALSLASSSASPRRRPSPLARSVDELAKELGAEAADTQYEENPFLKAVHG